MNRILNPTASLFFAATLYMILAESVHNWIDLPTPDNIGFTLIFVLFAITHCAATEGPRRTALFFAISAVVSWCLEEIGVRSGMVYGVYHYSDLLGPKLGHVPVIIPLAWFMMIYPSWMVARTLLHNIDTSALPGQAMLALVGAWVMTSWDVVMDPGMAAGGNWIWEQGGPYFGVPLQNYFGWILTTFLVYLTVGWLRRRTPAVPQVSKSFAALPVILYAFYAIRYALQNRFPALQVVAPFSMGTVALLALIQLTAIHPKRS